MEVCGREVLYLVLTLAIIISSLMDASPTLVSSMKIVFKTERVVFEQKHNTENSISLSESTVET